MTQEVSPRTINPSLKQGKRRSRTLFFWQSFFLPTLHSSSYHPISTFKKAVYRKSWHAASRALCHSLPPEGQCWSAASEAFPILARIRPIDSLVFQVQDQGCLLFWAWSRVNAATPAQSWDAIPLSGSWRYYVFSTYTSLSKLWVSTHLIRINYSNMWKWRTWVSTWPANEGLNYTERVPHLASFWLGLPQISREIISCYSQGRVL